MGTKDGFDFIHRSKLWISVSLIIILVSSLVLGFRWFSGNHLFNLGIDFTGGASIVIRFDQLSKISATESEQEIEAAKQNFLSDVRDVLREFNLEQSSIQLSAGNDQQTSDLVIKTQPLDNEVRQDLLGSLEEKFGTMELIESDVIGPSIGEELASQSFKIIALAIVLLLVYITIRFEFAYAVSAIIALFHDAFITLGISAIFLFEVNTAYVAAILTILGYSINDTIVIFDRIRENVQQLKNKKDYTEIANISIRQSLARSINTSLTTLLVLGSIYFFGGDTIKNFSLILIIGIISGTYSSIFIASPLLVKLKHWQDES